ncbi:CocE/NonD family hydrolase [Rhodococcus sp. 3A]|uniref:CocE/NonD family hydrolase n=1 Tax=Rhodococcus sp. 3A TaxID=2834581 RepID=UPI00163AEA3A|nr:CocE/NonD family hydrolase [Rhodococcus sp. 3A]MBC2637743.1 CocE/NonD family hydrolase [Rhodococcus sp. 3A]
MEIEFDVEATMRDGAVLRADVYRPVGDGPWPVLVQRTPYDRRAMLQMFLDPFTAVSRGYILIHQDTRGRFRSEGDWLPFTYEAEDGYDTVRWAASLPGSSGVVGMFGASYTGNTQWAAALAKPPELRAISPGVTWSDPSNGLHFRGGAIELGLNGWWSLTTGAGEIVARAQDPAQAFTALGAAIADFDGLVPDGYWGLPAAELPAVARHGVPDIGVRRALADPAAADGATIAGKHSSVEAAALSTGGWFDIFLQGTLDNHIAMTALGKPSRLIVGPWTHTARAGMAGGVVGEVNFGMASTYPGIAYDELQLDWFDHWLKGVNNGIDAEPPVKIFVMGINQWRSEAEWPPARAVDTPWYLGADATLTPAPPITEQTPDRYLYDPADPVRTRGGNLVMASEYPAGQFDQAATEQRPDVLVYTSEPLADNLEVTGQVRMRLHAATDAPSTDWVVRLCDVDTDGVSRNLCDGIQRIQAVPGEPGQYEIDLWSTSNVFLAGHRIRVQVTSSNFPRWDRNLNTAEPATTAVTIRTAQQTIFHDAARPSHIILPVVPPTP